MKKFILVSLLLISLQIILFAQNDSIMTFKLIKHNTFTEPLIKIINPFKQIVLLTVDGLKYKVDTINIIGDTIIIIKKDTVLLSNIRKISIKTNRNIGKYIVAISMEIIGTLVTGVGIIYWNTSVDTMDGANTTEQERNKHLIASLITVTGVGTIYGGIRLLTNRHYNIKNNWTIKSSYYKFKKYHPSRHRL